MRGREGMHDPPQILSWLRAGLTDISFYYVDHDTVRLSIKMI